MLQDALTPAGYVLPTVELAFIATAVYSPVTIGPLLEQGVTVDHFGTRQTKLAWMLAVDLPPEGDRILEFGKRVVLDDVLRLEVGATFVSELIITPTIIGRESLEYHWCRLEGARVHRCLTAEAHRLTRALEGLPMQDVQDVHSIAAGAASGITVISENVKPAALMHISRAAFLAMEECENALVEEEFPDVKGGRVMRWTEDEFARLGNAPRGLIVIGGQTSAGKSVLALQMANDLLEQKRTGIIFSLEMGEGEIVRRLGTVRQQTTITSILNPYGMNEWCMGQTTEAISKLGTDNLWINTEAGVSIEKARAIARCHHRQHPLDFVVFDYIQIAMCDSRAAGDNREAQVSYIAAQLKQMSRELDCMVITASQLNDEGKLRESRAIGQHADVVLQISDEGIWIGKNRAGERNLSMNLWLDGARQRFLKNAPTPPQNGRPTKR